MALGRNYATQKIISAIDYLVELRKRCGDAGHPVHYIGIRIHLDLDSYCECFQAHPSQKQGPYTMEDVRVSSKISESNSHLCLQVTALKVSLQ